MGTSKGQCCDDCVTTRAYTPDGRSIWNRNFGTDTIDMYVDSGDIHLLGNDELKFEFLRDVDVKNSGNKTDNYTLPFQSYIYNPYNYKKYNNLGQDRVLDNLEELSEFNEIYTYTNSFNMVETSGNTLTNNAILTSKKHSYNIENGHNSHKKARVFSYNSGVYAFNNDLFVYKQSGDKYQLNGIFKASSPYDVTCLDNNKFFLGSKKFVDGGIRIEHKSGNYDLVDIYYNYPKFYNDQTSFVNKSGLYIDVSSSGFTAMNNGSLSLGNCSFVSDGYVDNILGLVKKKSINFEFFKDRVEIKWRDSNSCQPISSIIYGGEVIYRSKSSNSIYNDNTACEAVDLEWEIDSVIHDTNLCQFIVGLKKSGEFANFSDNDYKYSTFINPQIEYYHENKSILDSGSVNLNSDKYFSDTWTNWFNANTYSNDISGCFIQLNNNKHTDYIFDIIENYNSGYNFSYSSLANGNIYRETGVLSGKWKMINSNPSLVDYSNGKYLAKLNPNIQINDESSDYYTFPISGGCMREEIWAFSKDYFKRNGARRLIAQYVFKEECIPVSGTLLSNHTFASHIESFRMSGQLNCSGYLEDYRYIDINNQCHKLNYIEPQDWIKDNSDNISSKTYSMLVGSDSGIGPVVWNNIFSFKTINYQSHLYKPVLYDGVIDYKSNVVKYDGQLSSEDFGFVGFPATTLPAYVYIDKSYGSCSANGSLVLNNSNVTYLPPVAGFDTTGVVYQNALQNNPSDVLYTPQFTVYPIQNTYSNVVKVRPSIISEPNSVTCECGEMEIQSEFIFSGQNNVTFGSLKTEYFGNSTVNTLGGFDVTYGRWSTVNSIVVVFPVVLVNGCVSQYVALTPFFISLGEHALHEYPDTYFGYFASEPFFNSNFWSIKQPINWNLLPNGFTYNCNILVPAEKSISNSYLQKNLFSPYFYTTHYPNVIGFFVSGQIYSGINTAIPCNNDYSHSIISDSFNTEKYISVGVTRFGNYIKEYFNVKPSSTFFGPHSFKGCGFDGYGSGIFYDTGINYFNAYQRKYDNTNWVFDTSGVNYVIETGYLSNNKSTQYNNYGVYESSINVLDINRNTMSNIR